MGDAEPSFLNRNEFLIRRLHSLSGLIPVGAYMVVHLLTNASVLNGPATFQRNVYLIHSLEGLLPLVEWVFIFIPILFHAIVGVVIIRGGLTNHGTYGYSSNVRYSMQRVTGMLAFAFIAWHVFHMHGWFHFEPWYSQAQAMGGAKFNAFNASSSAGSALQGNLLVVILYAVGVLSCVFHLANGIWTMGITWGVWISPAAQKRALAVCSVFGVLLAIVGLSSLGGMATVDIEAARAKENAMYEARTASGEVTPNEHKRSGEHPPAKEAAHP